MGKDIPPSTKWFYIAVLVSSLIFITSGIQASIGKLPDYPQKGQLSLSKLEVDHPNSGKIVYEVKNGDIFISILKRYNVSIGDALNAAKKIDKKTLRKIKPGGEIDLTYSKDKSVITEIGYTFRNEKRKVLYSGKGLSVSAVRQASVTKYNRSEIVDPSKKPEKTSVIASFKPRPVVLEKGHSKIMLSSKGQKSCSIQVRKELFQKDTIPGPAELIASDLEFIPGMVPWEISDKSYEPLNSNTNDLNNYSIFNAPRSVKNRFKYLMHKERQMLLRAKLAAKNEFLKAPLAYKKITSKFAWRVNPITGNPEHHTGVDYAASYGTPVKSIGYGKVIFSGWRNGYGETIQIRHHDGYISQYAHLSRFGKGIKEGKAVKRGDVIGYVGSSGMSTGPHLDLRVMKSGAYVNPLTLNKPLKYKNSKKYSSHKLRNKTHYQTNAKRHSKTTVANRR